MLLAGVAGLVEDLVGFAGGQAFVVQIDGKASQRAQFSSEGLGFGGLAADVAGEMHGVADYDAHHAEAAAETCEGAQVLTLVVLALQCQDWLGGQPEFV